VVALWRWGYIWAGFSTHATGLYHDPASHLWTTVREALFNLPVLWAVRWLLVPVDTWALLPSQMILLSRALSAGFLLGSMGLLLAWVRGHPQVAFWLWGSLLSLVPFAITMPMDRLVIFAGLGSSAVLTHLILSPSTRRGIAALLLVWQLPLSAVMAVGRGATIPMGVAMFTEGDAQAPQDPQVAEQTFVYLTSTFHRVHYLHLMRQTTGRPAPRRSLVLASALDGAEVERLDAHTLRVHVQGGYMAYDLDRIHRGDPQSLGVGASVRLPGATLTVVEVTADGRPQVVDARFERPLDDPSYRWLAVMPTPGAFPLVVRTEAVQLPAAGERHRVPPALPW